MGNEDLYWFGIDLANGILSGAMLGGYYALISVGLALNFGVMRLVNLSHGDWLIVAAYLCVVLLTAVPVAPFWALVVVVPVMYGIGYVAQRGLLNHVSVQSAERRGMSPVFGLMLPLLVTFGLSIVLSQGMLLVFSADAATIRNDLSFSAIRLGPDLSVSTLRLGFFVAAAVLIAALATWMRMTHIGRAIRAASDDAEMAALMGMRTPHVYAVASGVALATASIAGFMIGMSRSFQPFDGPPFLLLAFGVVVLGGLGSLAGSFVGGIVLGIVQVLAGTYFGPAAQQVAGYLLILLVLAVRPQGLFAR
ncbi:MAG: branched-chain amino acid ABC transporter permease [Burkholderiaceae bacterium]|jgi:branched-chain amino acid transport system permease protein|nr:branched-chain amino acid ABC transporter permease [Burkholderiaceae bacterium]MEB2351550.1 branched-chain amino acid ABC transporter permease [Burkholderiaceae bacterium]